MDKVSLMFQKIHGSILTTSVCYLTPIIWTKMVRSLKPQERCCNQAGKENQDLKSSQWADLQLTLTKDIYYNHQCKILLFNK